MSITIRITREMRDKIFEPLPPRSGWGGYQHLLYRLQLGCRFAGGDYDLNMTREDGEAVEKGCEAYGAGGYQNRLRPILALVKAALAKLPARPKQFGLFEEEPANV